MSASGSGGVSAVIAASTSNQGKITTVAGVPVTNPYGLRRWRACLADAENNLASIVCVGDSHVFGQNANGSDTSNPGDSAADGQMGWVGQLRNLFAITYGNPGEGFIMPDPAADSRMVASGGSTFSGYNQAVGPMRHNYRLTSGATLTFTPPAGTTQLGVIQTNHSGDAQLTWTMNGVGQTAPTAPTGTGVPSLVWVPFTGGQTAVFTGPSANNTVYGWVYSTGQVSANTALKNGVSVDRIGSGGQTQGIMLGGDYNGALGTYDGVGSFTTPQQQAYVQGHYIWRGSRGLLIMYFGTNEQSLQLGSAGLNNGITPAIFQAGLQLAVAQAVSDGWCVLLVGPCPSASENQTMGAALLTAYWAIMQGIAATTDHCAFVSIGDLWGGDTSAAKLATSNAGLRNAGDSHPTRAGYGDIARNLYNVLSDLVPVGN